MPLSPEEIAKLEDEVMKELPFKITEVLTRANRSGELDSLLHMLGMADLLRQEARYESYKDGKIVVVGGSDVKEDILLGIAKSLGLDKDRFEFCLDYKSVQKFDFRRMQYAPQYRVILFGPIPHSGEAKADSSSVITEIENNGAYPRAERLMAGNALKITKSNFKEKLQFLISEGYI